MPALQQLDECMSFDLAVAQDGRQKTGTTDRLASVDRHDSSSPVGNAEGSGDCA